MNNDSTSPTQRKEVLVIERFISDDVNYEIKNKNHNWRDISDPEHVYSLKALLADGYVIVNTAVSTSRCCSHSGYASAQDHTILTLIKTFVQ